MDAAINNPHYDDTLKFIAIFTMLIDHIGYLLFPHQVIWRMIGRLSFPIFAFLVARGSRLTRSQPRYFLRLFGYGLISQLPYSYFAPGGLNIFFTLAAGLAIIWCWSHPKIAVKALVGVVLLSTFFIDYSYGLYGLLLIFSFHLFYEKPFWMGIALTLLSWYYYATTHVFIQALALGALPLIYTWPSIGLRLPKHVGYLFYPIHITLLLLIKRYLMGI